MSKFKVKFVYYLFAFLMAACQQDPAFEQQSDEALNVEVGKDIEDITEFGREPLGKATASFNASVLSEGNLSFDLESQGFSQSITMSGNYAANSSTFTQVTRPVMNDTHTQGHQSQIANETFVQDEPDRELDILVVIDNSGSMSQEQSNLSTKLSPLLSQVADTNWRISVVTTDPNDSCQRPQGLIVKGDAAASTKFAGAVTAGTSGSGNERGVLRAVQGLQACSGVSPWVRSSSHLAVLVVSDEDNCSNGAGCGADPWGQIGYLTDYLSTIRVTGVNARVYGLFHIPGTACSTAYNVGNQYNSLVSVTNGSAGSICDTDYTSTLSRISGDISANLNAIFTLQNTPEAGSLQVFVNNVLRTSGYRLTGNVVEFTSNIPTAGSQIKFTYSYGSTPINTTFALSELPDSSTLNVYINNVKQASGYSYHSASNSVVFSQAPAQNSNILLSYRKATPALLKAFTIPAGVSNVKVKVNNVSLSAGQFSYNSSNGVVTLVSAPADGATIKIDYDTFASQKLVYDIVLLDWVLADMQVHDQNNVSVQYTYSNNQITFPSHEWTNGRVIIIESNRVNPDLDSFTLNSNVVASSIVASYNGLSCGSSNGLVVTSGNAVDLSGCGFNLNNLSIPLTVAFTYVSQQLQQFNLDPSMSQTSAPILVWEIKVNSQIETNYTIQNNVLKFDSALPVGAIVSVTVYYFEQLN